VEIFNDAFVTVHYTMLNGKMIVNGKFKRVEKEAVVAYFKVPSQNLPGGTEKKHENLSQNGWSSK
jgi:hypothetical protein